MLYCFNDKNFRNLPRTNREIAYALAHNSFIYYDENENVFKDYNDNIVDVNGIKVIPSSFVLQLPNMINALIKNGAIRLTSKVYKKSSLVLSLNCVQNC